MGDHLSRPFVAKRFQQPTRKHSGQLYRFLFGLASSGVYRALSVTRQAVSSYLAVPPLPGIPGGIFLLHWSGSRLHRTLSGTLPYEARTFLTCGLSALAAAITCPTHLGILTFQRFFVKSYQQFKQISYDFMFKKTKKRYFA